MRSKTALLHDADSSAADVNVTGPIGPAPGSAGAAAAGAQGAALLAQQNKSDVELLLELRASFANGDAALPSWNNNTHPCGSDDSPSWEGVDECTLAGRVRNLLSVSPLPWLAYFCPVGR